MAETARIHPLADRLFAAAGISLEPCPFAERISLRADAAAAARIGKALKLDLPSRPKTSVTSGVITALWLGPDEWLLLAEPGAGIAAKLAAIAKPAFSAVDISHRNTAIAVSGARSVTTLNSGCPQDLSLAAFPVGACSRTILGKSEIVLLREEQDRFRVECWRSFSNYVWKYLVDAAKSA